MPTYTFIGKPQGTFSLVDGGTRYLYNEDIVWNINRALKMNKVTLKNADVQLKGVAYYTHLRIQPKFITQAPRCTTFYSGPLTDAETFNNNDIDRNSIVKILDINDLFGDTSVASNPAYLENVMSVYNALDGPVLLGNSTQCAAGQVIMNFSILANVDLSASNLTPQTPNLVQFQLHIE